ncbi:uncharacterized protein METZ01_LOCUS337007, partial [marine metagenome]
VYEYKDTSYGIYSEQKESTWLFGSYYQWKLPKL